LIWTGRGFEAGGKDVEEEAAGGAGIGGGNRKVEEITRHEMGE
jgi:hypothetical protein